MMKCIALAHGQDKTITVFAAAGMKNALDDVDAAFISCGTSGFGWR
jgi:ABC-type molybdate transport system substrate-binding protein